VKNLDDIMSNHIRISPNVKNRIGEVCFFERTFGNGDKFYLGVLLVGPYDLEFRNVSLECQNMYRNVSTTLLDAGILHSNLIYFCIVYEM